MGWKHPEFAIKNVLFYLMPVDSSTVTLDQIAPERILVALRAYLALLRSNASDVSTRPPFPLPEYLLPSGTLYGNISGNQQQRSIEVLMNKPFDLFDEVHSRTLNDRYLEHLPKIASYLYRVIKTLHPSIGFLMTDEKFLSFSGGGTFNSGSNASSTGSYRMGTFNASYTIGSSGISDSLSGILSKEKQLYYDLAKAWTLTLPGFMSATQSSEEKDVIDLLIKYTVHVEPELSKSAQDALLRLVAPPSSYTSEQIQDVVSARRHLIVQKFSTFLMGLSDRVPDVMERSLKLYIDIWNTWFDRSSNDDGSLRLDPKGAVKNSSGGTVATISGVESAENLVGWERLQELETVGLLYLGHFMPTVRDLAVKVLGLAARLHDGFLVKPDQASKAKSIYLLKVIQRIPPSVLTRHRSDYNNSTDNIGSRVQDPNFLLTLAASDTAADLILWSKTFPDVIRICFEHCPTIVHNVLEYVGQRLLSITPSVAAAADSSRNQTATLTSKWTSRAVMPASEDLIDQWKFYLIYACSCMTASDPNWKKSKKPKNSTNLACAQELFNLAMPLLTSEKSSVRYAVVLAFGNVNHIVFRDLMEEFSQPLKSIIDDMRSRYMRGSVRRVKRLERLRAEITHIFLLATDVFVRGDLLKDEQFVKFVLTFIHEMFSFLSDNEVQLEVDHQILRFYFCTFIERFYESVAERDDPNRYVPFEMRYSLFRLFEEWCGHGQRGFMMREREAKMIIGVLEQVKDIRERGALTSAMEEQRKALEMASLKTLATLCRGPLISPDRTKVGVSFSLPVLFEWIESVFNSEDERVRPIGQLALESLLRYNYSDSKLWEYYVVSAYQPNPNHLITEGYFLAATDILSRAEYPGPKVKLISLALYKLADPKQSVRDAAVNMLKVIEDRYRYASGVRDYQLAARSNSPATYKTALRSISSEIAKNHPEITHELLSEVFARLELPSASGLQELVRLMLPWLTNIELTVDDRFGEIANLCWLLLWNMVHITARYSSLAETEVEWMWAEITKNNKNVKPITDFLIQHGLERRSHAFSSVGKRIVLYIGRTSASKVLIETLMSEMTPKSMIPVKKAKRDRFANLDSEIHYIAPLDDVLKDEARRSIMSKGLLATVYLTDFAMERAQDLEYYFPILIQAAIVQLDYYSSIAREHAKILLGCLMNHVLQKIPRQNRAPRMIELMTFLADRESVISPPNNKSKTISFPEELRAIVKKSYDVMSAVYQDFHTAWAESSVKWATSCPVRHIACRSLQVFRTIMPIFTQKMLADLLVRLSNTASDGAEDVQGFATEILLTLNEVATPLDGKKLILFPQLFWAAAACLNTSAEQEYYHALSIVNQFVIKLDLNDKLTQDILLANEPSQSQEFRGLEYLIVRGLGSAASEAISMTLLLQLATISSNPLIDRTESGHLFLVLGIVPTLLEGLSDAEMFQTKCARIIPPVKYALQHSNMVPLLRLLEAYEKNRFRNQDEFLKQFVSILRDGLLSQFELDILKILFGLLRNTTKYYRSRGVVLLRAILSSIDPTNSKAIAALASDVIQPLYLLLKTEHAAETTDVFDEVMRLTGSLTDSSIRSILGNKAISKMLKENSASSNVPSDQAWQFEQQLMNQTRSYLNAVISSYIGTQASAMKMSKSNEAMFTSNADMNVEGSRDQMNFMNDGDFVDYDELVSKLEDLDEFFTGDIGGAADYHEELAATEDAADSISENGSVPLDILATSHRHAESELDTGSRHVVSSAYSYASEDSEVSDGSFSLENALQKTLKLEGGVTPSPVSTPLRNRKADDPVLRLLTQPQVRVFLSIPTCQRDETFSATAFADELSAAVGLIDHRLEPVAEKSSADRFVVAVLGDQNNALSDGVELAALTEVIIETIHAGDMDFSQKQLAYIDRQQQCRILVGALDGIDVLYNPKQRSTLGIPATVKTSLGSDETSHSKLSEFSALSDNEPIVDLYYALKGDGPVGAKMFAVLSQYPEAFSALQSDLVSRLKSHMFKVSGRSDETYIRYLVKVLKLTRSLDIPEVNIDAFAGLVNAAAPSEDILLTWQAIDATMMSKLTSIDQISRQCHQLENEILLFYDSRQASPVKDLHQSNGVLGPGRSPHPSRQGISLSRNSSLENGNMQDGGLERSHCLVLGDLLRGMVDVASCGIDLEEISFRYLGKKTTADDLKSRHNAFSAALGALREFESELRPMSRLPSPTLQAAAGQTPPDYETPPEILDAAPAPPPPLSVPSSVSPSPSKEKL